MLQNTLGTSFVKFKKKRKKKTTTTTTKRKKGQTTDNLTIIITDCGTIPAVLLSKEFPFRI